MGVGEGVGSRVEVTVGSGVAVGGIVIVGTDVGVRVFGIVAVKGGSSVNDSDDDVIKLGFKASVAGEQATELAASMKNNIVIRV